jgi:hypothetical protein
LGKECCPDEKVKDAAEARSRPPRNDASDEARYSSSSEGGLLGYVREEV